jgi:hypothetical protein
LPAAARANIGLKARPSVSDITAMNLSLALLARWNRRSTLAAPSSLRIEVCPPSLRQRPCGTPWQRFMFWLLAPAPQEASPPPDRLPAVRTEFLATLSDLGGDDVERLRQRIGQARSLRELWHLRAEIYRVVGVARSQAEAEQRVALLNHHFPTRAPRSQFAPL